MRLAWIALGLTLASSAGCPHKTTEHDKPRRDDAHAVQPGSGAKPAVADATGAPSIAALPPAPPIPLPPAGLPALPDAPALAAITPDEVALGELLFWDGRLGKDGTTACATCHDPAHDFSGKVDRTAGGELNLRRSPSLANLAWARELAWDGRFTSIDDLMTAHVRGQLGQDLAEPMGRLALLPIYAAHLERVGGPPDEAARKALIAYVLTRYAGDSPWDRLEPSARAPKPGAARDPAVAGYLVFTGKGQCAVCHTPPLYSDFSYHVVEAGAARDAGRGKVVASLAGAFRTPSLRGAAARTSFLHDGAAQTLEQALDAHLAAGAAGAAQGSDAVAADPALAKLALTPDERADVLAFVRALTAEPHAVARPALP